MADSDSARTDPPSIDESWHLALIAGFGERMELPCNEVAQDVPAWTSIRGAPAWYSVWTSHGRVLHPPLYTQSLRIWRELTGNSDAAAMVIRAPAPHRYNSLTFAAIVDILAPQIGPDTTLVIYSTLPICYLLWGVTLELGHVPDLFPRDMAQIDRPLSAEQTGRIRTGRVLLIEFIACPPAELIPGATVTRVIPFLLRDAQGRTLHFPACEVMLTGGKWRAVGRISHGGDFARILTARERHGGPRDMAKLSPLAERLNNVRTRIAAACARAKREVSEVTLIAVTKTAGPEAIREIVSLGVYDLGESRPQQLQQRASQMNEMVARRRVHGDDAGNAIPALRWHMIGHLQRNKVKPLLPLIHCVHSVDSLRLAEELDAGGTKIGRKIPVMLQVNASEEPQKHGVAVGAAVHLGEQIATMPGVQLIGLMTMAELTEDQDRIRTAFRRTREIFEEMKWHKIGGAAFRHLSMGMSNDFEIAIEEGATMVRVGSALFGAPAEGTAEEHED